MQIISIKGTNNVYSSNVYMVLGEWKKINDVSTLIDVGSDPSIIDVINEMNTGIGKKKIDQVIVTHDHSDHMSILPLIIREYNPIVHAFSPYLAGATHVLKDGETLLIGDKYFEVIHTPGHSSDSISLYNAGNKVLFVGDTPVIVRGINGGTYEEDYVNALKRLCQKQVEAIYFGHGDPVFSDGQSLLVESLRIIRNSVRRENQAFQ
jgi:glyoxylase-like metal-dependent hydrolase (beta-lactamase superfamily II)